MGACLPENVILALVAGELSDEELQAAEAHLDGCAACREVVALAARDDALAHTRTDVLPARAPSSERAPLPPAPRIGRYRVLREVGAGGLRG